MAKYTFLKDSPLALSDVWAWAKKLVTDLNSREATLLASAAVATGSLTFWPVVTPPLGWVTCNGDSYAVDDYGPLFLVLGYAYGGAGGLFRVPDMRNRLLMGAGTTVALGATAGAATAGLVAANLPPHTHPVTDPGHTHVFTGAPHHHTGANGTGSLAGALSGLGVGDTGDTTATGTNASSTTGITVGNSTGASQPFSVLNPVFGVNVIIKT